MPRNNDPNQQTGEDMARARARTSIDVRTVRDYLYGGRAEWNTHSKVAQAMIQDPVFDKSQIYFMTRSERYKRALAMTSRIFELQEQQKLSAHESAIAVMLLDESVPMNLHAIAFEPVFRLQGSKYLIERYGKLIANRGILGCYLQTELGHGTNVSQLETTATYIPETQEFVINSPTLTSRKWWIGALAKTATHGVVQAKLILPGNKDLGPHLFFVQLRSLEDHRLLSGILLGDIGPKAMGGFPATDNGYAIFDHVKIPRENMLSHFAQVTAEGKYIQPPHAKLSYSGMLYIRSNMITSGGWTMAKAATVAIRYATVRRQGNKSDGLERQTITYPSVHCRLFLVLSHAYVFIQLGRNLTKAFTVMSTQVASGDTTMLAEMHATTAGLKILVTTTGIQDVEVARRSMGGHGYSAFAGLGRIYAEYLPSASYEGDNYVLDGQVVRAALKSYKNLLSAKDPSASLLSPSSYYLRLLLGEPVKSLSLTDASWKDPAVALLLLEWRAALVVQDLVRNQNKPDASANQRVSKAVSEAFVAAQVVKMIRELDLPAKDRHVVVELYRLYLLSTVETSLVDLLSFGLIGASEETNDPTGSLRMEIAELCLTLLPNVIGLSDAFGLTDWELDSALGVYDGRVYESLWNRVHAEPLNRSEIPAGYEEYIRPMLQRGQRLASSKL
ncbi:hypothetical protein PILCRDRAFT_820972 [Piloderma croceum F 1598]|uniref:Acyl-coenzyme A oxidase n=1 Tax=Piloderma croceum (strain F 1598) TaxID=765440 RepID=A0A0C3BXA3_PILCF|nr:hypothetical protein PILCRDRAFT_820972 [Piloderma croceum F 1598]